jgi:hypothetical protein
MAVCLSSVRGNKEERAMPSLETSQTHMPRSVLRHRPLSEADTAGPAPLYRRASRVQGSVETQPAQTGAQWTRQRSRRHLHPLLYLGLGMIAMLALWTLLSLAVSWWNTTMDDLHYGRPRTFQMDAYVGHNEGSAPSHFIALNYNGRIEVIEFPGGDATHARIYLGPQLYGAESELVPVTLSFVDVSGLHQPDMLVHFQTSRIIFINAAGSFRSPTAQEEQAVQRYLAAHGQ